MADGDLGLASGAAPPRSLHGFDSRHRRALDDFMAGLRYWPLWGRLGWQDIKLHYRRSILGPFWLTLTLAILVTVLGFLYSLLMNVPLERYMPHLALGFIGWQMMQGIISESCTVFISSQGWIKNVKLPLSLFVFKVIWRHLITLGHNAAVYVAVAVYFGINAGYTGLLVVPALLIYLVNAVWVGLLLGVLCARYRDIPQVIRSLMRVAFFATPVIWIPEQLGKRAYLAQFNPFSYFLELLRAPLLGETPDWTTWFLALGVTLVGWAVAWPAFARCRARIPYWV